MALLSTGDEVREPGTQLPPGAIYDANRFMLAALLERLGCAVSDFGIIPDREGALVDTLSSACTAHDLIVTSGGVSTGDEDHVKAAVERLGALHFWRLAIKPGRPVALGQIAGRAGNRIAGKSSRRCGDFCRSRAVFDFEAGWCAYHRRRRTFPVSAGFAYRKKPGRREYLRARLERDGDAVIAVKYPRDGAGILSSIVQSEGLVVLDETTGDLARRLDRASFCRFPGSSGEDPLFRLAARAHRLCRGRVGACRREFVTWRGCSLGCRRAAHATPRHLRDLSVVRVAVNQDYVGREHPLREGDEVAIFPPVTGG